MGIYEIQYRGAVTSFPQVLGALNTLEDWLLWNIWVTISPFFEIGAESIVHAVPTFLTIDVLAARYYVIVPPFFASNTLHRHDITCNLNDGEKDIVIYCRK